MTEIAMLVREFGLTGAVFIFLLYHVFFLTRKLLNIIETNTKAMTKTSEAVDKVNMSLIECHRSMGRV